MVPPPISDLSRVVALRRRRSCNAGRLIKSNQTTVRGPLPNPRRTLLWIEVELRRLAEIRHHASSSVFVRTAVRT
jgi:hypothetical protein